MRTADKTTDAWTHYWRSGHLATCFTGKGTEHDFDARDFWTAFFKGFEDNAVLLDICTGNGAVALLAAETALAEGRKWFVHGADAADIRPHASLRNVPPALRNVRFWPGVEMEKLPFEDGAIDGISGQYALEYTDTARSIPELARVLRVGGRLGLLLHAADGRIVESSRATSQDLKRLFEELHILRAAQAAFSRLYPSAGVSAEREDLKKKHKAVLEDFEARLGELSAWAASDTASEIVEFVAQRLTELYANRDRYHREDIFNFLANLESELRHYRERMKAISHAALTETDVKGIAEAFADHGLLMEQPGHLRNSTGGDFVGWTLYGRRPHGETS